MNKENNTEIGVETGVVETTIGDLISAITEIAEHAGQSAEQGYKLAQDTLADVLARQAVEYNVEEFEIES